jgi:hypothetical protein
VRFPRRPEICTREYLPVCGLREVEAADGATSREWKTYSTGCTACSDPSVIGYVEGACPEAD